MIFQVECIINTKLPSCVDIIQSTSHGFIAGALKALVRPGPQLENLMMYGGLYQHIRVVLYMYLNNKILYR